VLGFHFCWAAAGNIEAVYRKGKVFQLAFEASL